MPFPAIEINYTARNGFNHSARSEFLFADYAVFTEGQEGRRERIVFLAPRAFSRQLMHLPAGRLIILDITPRGKKTTGGRAGRGRIGLSLGDSNQAAEGCPRRMAVTFLKLVTTRSQPVNLLLALSDPVTFFRRSGVGGRALYAFQGGMKFR